jgi:hypothetical protein
MRYCPRCAARLETTTSRGGLTRRTCPNCDRDDGAGRYGGNTGRLVADGGRPAIGAGDRVRDLESDSEERLLVVGVRDTVAGEYIIAELGESVAAVNPGYPAEDPVAVAVYVDDVESRLDGWRSVEDVLDAVALDALRSYSFPASRLERIDTDDETGVEAFL